MQLLQKTAQGIIATTCQAKDCSAAGQGIFRRGIHMKRIYAQCGILKASFEQDHTAMPAPSKENIRPELIWSTS